MIEPRTTCCPVGTERSNARARAVSAQGQAIRSAHLQCKPPRHATETCHQVFSLPHHRLSSKAFRPSLHALSSRKYQHDRPRRCTALMRAGSTIMRSAGLDPSCMFGE